ncbi:MAG: DUF1007 family protein [Bauldia sp.]|nr:DUF1007 family protein [Bauldia sp.]
MSSRITGAIAGLCLGLASAAADAHPHAWVLVDLVPIFDAEGRWTAVRETWTVDRGDALSQNFEKWLAPEDYFTRLTIGGRPIGHAPISDLEVERGALEVRFTFTVPLEEPAFVTLGAGVDVFDEEFYYDIDFSAEPAGENLPPGCTVARRAHANVDPVAAMLIRRLGLPSSQAVASDPAAGYPARVAIDCAPAAAP